MSSLFATTDQEPLNLPGRKTRSKISKRHFFQDIKKSFHGVTQMGPKPHQIFFLKKYLNKHGR